MSSKDLAFIAENHAARVRSIIGVDRKIGIMIDHLETTGQLSNTLIIFHSDNGFMMGEHGFRTGKNIPYEPSVRVPLVMAGPGIPVGTGSTMVTLHDVSATIMDLAGATPGWQIDGVSIVDILADQRRFRDRPILYEAGPTFNNKGLGLRSERGERFYTAIHYRRWVYIRYYDGQQELYDLRNDPNQLRSLHRAATYDPVRAALARELVRLQDCKGDGCNRRIDLHG